MMEHDSAPFFRVEAPGDPIKRCELEFMSLFPNSSWLITMKTKLWSIFSLSNQMRGISPQGLLLRLPSRLTDAIMHMHWTSMNSGNSTSKSRTCIARLRL